MPDAQPVRLNGSAVCGRVVALVPGVTRFNHKLASRYAQSQQEIADALQEVRRGRGAWAGESDAAGACSVQMSCGAGPGGSRHRLPHPRLTPLAAPPALHLNPTLPPSTCPCPYRQARELHEEGIVIKDLRSPWVPNDRSGHWLKCAHTLAWGVRVPLCGRSCRRLHLQQPPAS